MTNVKVGLRELVNESNPAHVKVQVFVGRQEGSRGNAGKLTLRRDEWEELKGIIEREHEDEFGSDGVPIWTLIDIMKPLDLNEWRD